MASPRVWLFGLLLCVALSGCARFKKAKECGLVADAVSAWMKQDNQPTSPASSDTAALVTDARATAARYRALDKTLSEITLVSEELTPLVSRYRKLALDSARALDDVAEALDKEDLERARKLRVDFDTTIRAEAPLVNEINAVCRR
ncbi:MAG: hypothetical protein M3020_06995 [Myxococcota bacterium]|nr:hypothetical protein [Myxococcota bacterium]